MDKKLAELRYSKLTYNNGKIVYLHDVDIVDCELNILRKYRGITTKDLKEIEGSIEFI